MRNTEENLVRLFSYKKPLSEHLIRWQDEILSDMHDHNFFAVSTNTSPEEIASAIRYQRNKGDDFVKLIAHDQLSREVYAPFALEEECTLSMARAPKDTHSWTTNPEVSIKNLHGEASCDDLLNLELEIFGTPQNKDFIQRKMQRYFAKVSECPELDFYAAYLGDRIVGSLFTFYDGSFVALDGLAVRAENRKTYVATTLIKHVVDEFACPAYLHAAEDETSRELYAKLGFETVDVTYEYFAALKPLGTTETSAVCE